MIKKAKFRIIAFILLVTTLVGVFPAEAVSYTEPTLSATVNNNNNVEKTPSVITDKVYVLYNDVQYKVLDLGEQEKKTLTSFVNDLEVDSRAWQILTPDGQKWVNIYGRNGETLDVGYALVSSMLNEEGAAYLRLSVRSGEDTYVSEPVEIKISYNADTDSSDSDEQYVFSMASNVSAVDTEGTTGSGTQTGTGGTGSTTQPGEGELQIVSIVINYLFDDGSLAFEPYGATIAKNSDFKKTIASPVVVGFDPFIRVVNADGSAEYIDARNVVFNHSAVTENITVNVIYLPAIVKYQVHHHFQDLYTDEYRTEPDRITTKEGLNGSVVPENLAFTPEELPGYTALPYEKLKIAADGSTVVEIRYERKYYLVDFDMKGGYGVEPVYTRFESELGVNQPIRHGFVFDRWQLVSFGGRAPSPTEETLYDINPTSSGTPKTIKVPAANLSYRAVWITQLANYTMVFWRENAEDNGFSFWAALDGLTAMSGSLVDAEDRIDEVPSVTDENYFTYMPDISDKKVVVEGDGSSVVNVYYSRNRYTITFKAKGLCTIPERHTHTDSCYTLLCSKYHVHTDECVPVLICETPAHEAHTDACITCGFTEHIHTSSCCGATEHTHTKDCYQNVGNAANPYNAPLSPENGYIYKSWGSYYVYLFGTWYRYNGRGVSTGDILDPACKESEHTHGEGTCPCNLVEHDHVASCYKDTIHIHDPNDCYGHSCGQIEHVHSDGCRVLECAIPTGHAHTNSCKSSSTSNTVKLVRSKYEHNLEDIWPVTDDNGKTYDQGQRWTPSSSSYYDQVLVYIANMPPDDFTLTLSESSNDTYTMNYYLEVLEGESYDTTYQNKKFKLYKTVKANYNYLTKAEDFFDISGFYQLGSTPSFSGNQLDINGGGTVNMYYGRNVDHNLEFNNNGTIVTSKSQYGQMPYGSSIKQYYFKPEYPANLEPNAYEFGGWYTTDKCYPGTEVNWDTAKVGTSDMMFYAKWTPVVHTVKVFLDSSLEQQIGVTQSVSHHSFAKAPEGTITNEGYVFQGWFYSDTIDGVVVEKAFVFTGIPIIKDLEIYAKWSSHVSVDYTIKYLLKGTTTPVADEEKGSTIAGNNKTFYAKAGNDLYEQYRVGYYPAQVSHTVTMSVNPSGHVFVFEYTHVEKMPYLVRYVNENGEDIIPPKKVMDNEHSVVTENFVRFNGKMPDAYQKRLVLSTDSTDSDGDGVLDANVIIFRYKEDSTHAYYKVVHYIQNVAADGYREYRSEETVGVINQSYTFSPISVAGFSYNSQKTAVNGVIKPSSGSTVTEKLTSDGLLIEMYYDRVQVDYVVKYLDNETSQALIPQKTGQGIFGEQIVEYAPGLTHKGYALVGSEVQQIHLSTNATLNVITFKYQEITYSISYQIVGTPEGATLSLVGEAIKAVSGVPNGSKPTIHSGFHYDGWYFDVACEHPVPEAWVNPETKMLVPEKENDSVWLSNQTYYLLIDPDYTDLTINTVGMADVDKGQTYLFHLKGISSGTENVDLTVAVSGNGSVTITHLPIGEYQITEITTWSYRYTPDEVTKTIILSYSHANSIIFSQIRTGIKWLDGNDNADYKNADKV